MFTLDIAGRVATIMIDRGSKANAVPIEQWAHLERLVVAANTSQASLLVVRSGIEREFCVGSDLGELNRLASNPSLIRRFRGAMRSVFSRIQAVNKPTIAIVDGRCVGTGLSIAASCDIRVAGPNARFAVTPARFGISYPKEDVERLAKLIGVGQAARLLYSCQTIDGDEALRIGLVEMVDRSQDVGASLIREIGDNVPASLMTLKASLIGRAGVDQRFDSHFGSSECRTRLGAYCSDAEPAIDRATA